MFRSSMLLPGSDFLIAGIARILAVLGAVGVVVTGTMTFLRRRRERRRTRTIGSAGGVTSPVDHNRTARPTAGGSVDSVPRATPGRGRPSAWSRAPRGVRVASVITVVGIVGTLATWPPSVAVPEFPALPQRLLPDTSLFYRPVDDLPVLADSDRWIDALDSLPLTARLGDKPHLGNVAGVPFNLVDHSSPMIDVNIVAHPKNSFPGPYPLSDPVWIEGFFTFGNDQHYLAIDPEQRRAWELIALRRWLWMWEADGGGTWSMDSNDYPTGATIVARIPLLPGVIRYDEVESGSIDHMILAASPISGRGRFIWPARNSDGVSDDPDAPPMGAWMRLKADADLSGLGPQAKVIASAAQRHGVMISDTGPRFRLRGTPDRRWDTKDLQTLEMLTVDDFEFIDSSLIKVSDDSLEAVQPGAVGADG